MSDQVPRQSDELARRLGTAASRLRRAAKKAQPEVERQARTAAAAARPTAEKALRFVREHDREIRSAGTMGARAMASRVGPPALRPVMLVVADELVRDKSRAAPADDAPEGDNSQPSEGQTSNNDAKEPRTGKPPHIF